MKPTLWSIAALLCSSTVLSLPQVALAQTEPLKPTARYARGEDVDLALIIAEWREPYPNLPIFACVCDGSTCNHTERWPFREFNRYQLTVALGAFNAGFTESNGFNCFNIETGQRPDEAKNVPEPDPNSGSQDSDMPTVSVVNDATSLKLTWADGQSNIIDIDGWNVNVLDALDCSALEIVPEKVMFAQRIIGEPAVDETTGNIAVSVLLSECVETQQSAIFVVDPQGVGAHALYRTQVPGDRPFPNVFSSYPLSSISGLQYWDDTLLVRHDSASGAEAMLMFRSGRTPAGEFAGCGFIQEEEGGDRLCPNAP